MASQRNSNVIRAMAAFLFVAVLWPTQGWSQDLPEGVSIEKVQVRKFTLQPGAELANFTVEDEIFCHATDGVVSVVDHTAGTSTLYTAGSRWAETKGSTFTISNPGDDIHVHWMYTLIDAVSEMEARFDSMRPVLSQP